MAAKSTQPTIIILNGTSSAGKTSIIRELQNHLPHVYLRLGIDPFLGMLPPYLFGTDPRAKQGFFVTQTKTPDGFDIADIHPGPEAQKLIDTMYKTVELFVKQGHNLIIDEVLIAPDAIKRYQHALKNARVYVIGIHAPLSVIEQRERDRGDRIHGLARAQYDIVHKNKTNDLEIDSSVSSPASSAQRIISFINNNPTPKAFLEN